MQPIRIKRLMRDDSPPRFPTLGRLHKGAEKGENRPGKDLPGYFRYTSDLDPESVADFYNIYGNEPRRVPFRLPYQTVDENFSEAVEWWGAGKLMERGDGETAFQWRDPQTNEMRFDPKPQSDPKDNRGNSIRRPVMRLDMILPDMLTAGRFGIVRIASTSVIDIVTVRERLEAIESMRGDLRGIDLVLTRVQRKVVNPNDGKGYMKWMLEITVDPRFVMMQLEAQHQMAYQALLPTRTVVDNETGEFLTLPANVVESALDGDVVDDDDEFVGDDDQVTEPTPDEFEVLGTRLYGELWGGEIKKAFVSKKTRIKMLKDRLAALTDQAAVAEHLTKIMPELGDMAEAYIATVVGTNDFDAEKLIDLFTAAQFGDDNSELIDRMVAEYEGLPF